MTDTTCSCYVQSIESLTPFVFKVSLKPERPLSFIPGQYISVILGEGDFRPFSIASTPAEQERIELHIGATPENPYAWEVLQHLQTHEQILISEPQGGAGLTESERPLIVIAGGTGFSYAWSIVQAHLASSSERSMTLFWGARAAEDLYAHQELVALSLKDSRFEYRPVVENPGSDWSGATGLVHRAVLESCADLSPYDVYIAGRFEMVRVARDDFYAQGLPKGQLFGDALGYL